MKKCYKCDLQFDNDKLFYCPYCGAPLAMDREYHAELAKKEKEQAEKEAKAKAWKDRARSIDKRYVAAWDGFVALRRGSPYALPVFHRLDEPRDEKELALMEEQKTLMEDLRNALDKKAPKGSFPRYASYLNHELEGVKKQAASLETMVKAKGCSAFCHQIISLFLHGGSISHRGDTHNGIEQCDYVGGANPKDSDGFRPKGLETVGYSSISYEDRKKYNLREPDNLADWEKREGYRVVYRRWPIHAEDYWTETTLSFPSGGIEKKIENLKRLSSFEEEFLKIYSDLQKVYSYLREYSRSYPGRDDAEEVLRQFRGMLLFTLEMKEERKTQRRNLGYRYSSMVEK